MQHHGISESGCKKIYYRYVQVEIQISRTKELPPFALVFFVLKYAVGNDICCCQ